MQEYRADFMGEEEAKELPNAREFFERQKKELAEAFEARMDDAAAGAEAKGYTLINRRKLGRNDPCPCNSGLKFKKCCINKANR